METKATKSVLISFGFIALILISSDNSKSSDLSKHVMYIRATSAQVMDFRLDIENKKNKAYLKYTSCKKRGRIPIKLSPTCYFNSNEKGEPIILEWNHKIMTLLLESSKSIPGDQNWCDTKLQGLVIQKENIYLSDTIMNVRFCPPNRQDDKIFFYYAEEFNNKINQDSGNNSKPNALGQ